MCFRVCRGSQIVSRVPGRLNFLCCFSRKDWFATSGRRRDGQRLYLFVCACLFVLVCLCACVRESPTRALGPLLLLLHLTYIVEYFHFNFFSSPASVVHRPLRRVWCALCVCFAECPLVCVARVGSSATTSKTSHHGQPSIVEDTVWQSSVYRFSDFLFLV